MQQERDSWKRRLDYLSQENTLLKIRLAEVLKSRDEGMDLLIAAEQYQNWFLQQDDIIRLLRYEIAGLDAASKNKELNKREIHTTVRQQQVKLENELVKTETAFNNLKNHFNKYVDNSSLRGSE